MHQNTGMKNCRLPFCFLLLLCFAFQSWADEGVDSAHVNGVQKTVSIGSGFFISNDGYVLTAYHVLAKREKVLVKLSGNIIKNAALIKADPVSDLALLKIEGPSTPLAIANWSDIPVGLEVYVVGYPLPSSANMGIRITEGLINGAVGLGPRRLDLFQLSAQVQKGNSGGPVLTPEGMVVGMVQGKLDALQVAEKTHDLPQNVNFALKSSVLMRFLEGSEVRAQYAWINLSKRYRPYEILRLSEQSIVQVIGVGAKE
jgi:S1-C subfamily serine protease